MGYDGGNPIKQEEKCYEWQVPGRVHMLDKQIGKGYPNDAVWQRSTGKKPLSKGTKPTLTASLAAMFLNKTSPVTSADICEHEGEKIIFPYTTMKEADLPPHNNQSYSRLITQAPRFTESGCFSSRILCLRSIVLIYSSSNNYPPA